MFQVSKAIGKFVTKVYKYNKRGIDIRFLNQQSPASIILKVSKALPICTDVDPAIILDKVKNEETVQRDNIVLWTTDWGSVAWSLRSVRRGVL